MSTFWPTVLPERTAVPRTWKSVTSPATCMSNRLVGLVIFVESTVADATPGVRANRARAAVATAPRLNFGCMKSLREERDRNHGRSDQGSQGGGHRSSVQKTP